MRDADKSPTLVFSWHEGRKFVYGLTGDEVATRFNGSDRDAVQKLARANYLARKRPAVVIHPAEIID